MTCTRAAITIAWVLIVLVAIFVLIVVGEGSPQPNKSPNTTSNLRPPNNQVNDDSSDSRHQSDGTTDRELLWSDEFDGDELNQKYWAFDSVKTVFQQEEEQPYDDDLIKNVPLEPIGTRTDLDFYDPHAISVKDGTLTIVTRQVINAGVPFVSGRVKTEGKILLQYGTVEARIRIRSSCKQGIDDVCVSAQNFSPSFWTRGSGSTSYGEPVMGQVDIFSAALPKLRRTSRTLSQNPSIAHWHLMEETE